MRQLGKAIHNPNIMEIYLFTVNKASVFNPAPMEFLINGQISECMTLEYYLNVVTISES